MPKRPSIQLRRALRTALLLTVAGCDAGATFGGCWTPQITFSGIDAGAQTQTTSATVPAAPRADDRATTDQSQSPDESASTSSASSSSSGTPQPLYNRIPAFPQPPPAPSAPPAPPRSTVVYYVPTTGGPAAPGAPGAPATQAQQGGAPGEVSSEGTPNGEAPPPTDIVAIPLDFDSRRVAPAPEGTAVMPGVRPPPPPGPQPPQAQGSQEQAPPPPVLPGPRAQQGPMNFRVPPPPPPGPPVP